MKRLTTSALVMAAYIVLTVGLAPISYGPIQIRFSSGLYALCYMFPWLALPFGLAASMANYFGGMGIYDVIFGGLATWAACWLVGRIKHKWFALIPTYTIIPLVVAAYLSVLFGLPFWVLALQIAIGQAIAVNLGAVVVYKVVDANWRNKFEQGN